MESEGLITISGPIIQEEAFQFTLKSDVTGFTASNGWLQKWKTKHNIKQFRVAGGDGKVNAEMLGSWNEQLPEY